MQYGCSNPNLSLNCSFLCRVFLNPPDIFLSQNIFYDFLQTKNQIILGHFQVAFLFEHSLNQKFVKGFYQSFSVNQNLKNFYLFQATLKKNFENSIVFNKVNFSYVEGFTVLNNVSVEINKGQTVAIVGSTGSGK